MKCKKGMDYTNTHVLLAPSDWGSLQTHPQEKAIRLAKRNRVLYIESSPRYIQVRGKKDGKNFTNRLLNRNLRKINDNLYVATPPPMLPLQFSIISRFFHNQVVRIMIALSKKLLLISIRAILKRLNWQIDYLWVWYPYDVHIVKRLGEKKSIYRTFDEVGEWMSSKEIKNIIEELDIEMCQKVDYVFCSAKSQYDKRRHLNPATHFVPFGVNFKHFNQTLKTPPDKPFDWPIASNKNGIIGFAGAIDWRFDFNLVEMLACNNKNLNFVLVGPYRNYGFNTLENLCRLDNVFWLGEKPFSVLPNYISWFDVGIIPYKVGPDTNTMRIYKVFEYLACGKAVISTDLYEMRQIGKMVSIANDFEEFQKKIYESLNFSNDPGAIKERVSLAQKLDWDNIYKQLAEIANFQ